MDEIEKVIDIEKEFRSSNSRFMRNLPGFAINCVRKLVREDEMNATIYRSRHLRGVPFIDDVLEGWKINIDISGEENLPKEGRFIFVANHPVGAMDALSFFSVIYRFYPDVISPSNEMLGAITNLRPLMIGLNVFGRNTKETARKLEELFKSDTQIMLFPSGEVSRRKKGIITDPVWQKTFITKAVQYKRDVIPVHISGRNSNLFYILANLRTSLGIKTFIESALLPREMMNQRNSTFTYKIGKPIPYQTFTNEKSHHEWAQHVKESVYSL